MVWGGLEFWNFSCAHAFAYVNVVEVWSLGQKGLEFTFREAMQGGEWLESRCAFENWASRVRSGEMHLLICRRRAREMGWCVAGPESGYVESVDRWERFRSLGQSIVNDISEYRFRMPCLVPDVVLFIL